MPKFRLHHFQLLALLFSCATPDIGQTGSSVVYGSEDRRDIYEVAAGTHRSIAESAIAMQAFHSVIAMSGTTLRINSTRTLAQAHDLCAGELYAEQLAIGSCSGTLIDDQHVLTAGHCLDSPDACTERGWLFGFRHISPRELAEMHTDDYYRCSEIVVQQYDSNADFAIARLDRRVSATHRPVPFGASPPLGTDLTMIGHPNGIPMKLAAGATVTSFQSGTEFLHAPLDSFAGNSGSGVFDDDGNIVAILVAGAADYQSNGSCNVVNTLPQNATGETLTIAAAARAAFCARVPTSSACMEAIRDAGVNDAGVVSDAGAEAGLSDAAVSDAALSDAAVSDAGIVDAGTRDAAASDASLGLVDAGNDASMTETPDRSGRLVGGCSAHGSSAWSLLALGFLLKSRRRQRADAT